MIELKSNAYHKLISVFVLVLATFQPIFVLAQEAPVDPAPTDPPISDPAPVDPPVTDPEPEPVPDPAPVADPEPEPVPVPKPTTPGPTEPTGASGNTYEYNSATGMWENDYYIWDPVTRLTSPKQPQTYSYNPITGRWDTEEWVYDAALGRYVENTYVVDNVPDGAIVDLPPELVAALGLDVDADGNPIWSTNNTGPGSLNEIDLDNDSNSIFNLFYDSSISGNIYSNAKSGNATVSGNTTGGSALTGDAAAMVNLINMIQSSWGFGSSPLTFISNLFGDIVGDLVINPGQPNSTGCNTCPSGGDLDINADINSAINNDIIVNAQSGNASVNGNTTAGSATTGDANAVVNIINLINSAIGAGQSFFGVLNIFGDFEGDILFPDGFLETLLATNSGSTSPVNTGDNDSDEVNINLDDNQTINNNIGLGASSGNANVSGNTTAGNASTGQAETNLTLLNLTGRQVIGGNALLVFVNVLGNWLGLIMDAPGGTTAAAIGGDVEQNNCNACIPSGDTNIDVDNNSVINNNILVNAGSGDADVSHNTTAGNATTGDATASANILNISNSTFALTDWFGVLFINVFGDWSGSFGVDTAYGEPPKSASVTKPKSSNNNSHVQNSSSQVVTYGNWGQYPTDNESDDEQQGAAALSANTGGSPSYSPQRAVQEGGLGQHFWTLGGLGLGMVLLGVERFLTFRRQEEEALALPREAQA